MDDRDRAVTVHGHLAEVPATCSYALGSRRRRACCRKAAEAPRAAIRRKMAGRISPGAPAAAAVLGAPPPVAPMNPSVYGAGMPLPQNGAGRAQQAGAGFGGYAPGGSSGSGYYPHPAVPAAAAGGYYLHQRPQPDKASIDGKAVYMFGTGADRMRKTEGKLVLCGQSGEIKIEVPNSDPLTAAEFAQLARHRWKRPRASIKLAHSDQSLEDFEYEMNAAAPGTCRRYPHERDTEEQQRAEIADTARMRQLKKAHERSVRRSMKRKAANDPEHVGVVGQAEIPELRAGTWAPSGDAPAEELGEVDFNRKVDKLHRTWKKNSSILYDLVMIQMLECPSLTVQWLPDTRAVPGYPAFAEHRFLIGTYSSAMPQEEEKPEKTEKRGRKPAPKPVQRDYLMVAAVQLPRSISSTREDMDPEDRLEDNVLYKQSQVSNLKLPPLRTP